MNLRACPVCKNLCSFEATACPKCGHPLAPQEENIFKSSFRSALGYYRRQSTDTQKWIVLTGIVGVVTIGLISFGISIVLKSHKSAPKLERELCSAALEGEFTKLKGLIDTGVNVNTSVYKSANPLTLAILSAAPSTVEDSPSEAKRMLRLQMVRLLLDSGADVNKGNNTQSPLAIARTIDDDKDLEEMLLNAGANPDTAKDEGADKDKPKKINAVLMKLLYHFEASEAAKKDLDEEKQKIIGNNK